MHAAGAPGAEGMNIHARNSPDGFLPSAGEKLPGAFLLLCRAFCDSAVEAIAASGIEIGLATAIADTGGFSLEGAEKKAMPLLDQTGTSGAGQGSGSMGKN